MAVEFRILGPLDAVTEHGPARLGGRRQRGVLAILLLHANEVVSVERLADELYGGAPPPTAAAQVRDHVSQLRKLLGPEAAAVLETRSPGYVARVDPEQLDAARFERLVEAAAQHLAREEDAQAAAVLREALALWRGPALADLAPAPFAQPVVARLEELRLTALERRIEADLRLGRDGALVGELEALVAQHPMREQFRAQLMLALYRSGRHAEAVAHYHTGRRALVDELGIEPSAQLRRLAGLILREDESLAPPPVAAEPARVGTQRNPYKGLLAFGESDAEDFFGRERLTGDLVARLATRRFLAVVGPSGSGKSSVVLAGLVPALHAGALPGSARWKVVVTTPGAHPLEELEAALLRVAVNPPPSLLEQLEADELGLLRAVKRVLPDDDSELLLVVDQLEELFTLVDDEQRRAHVLSMIERAVRDPRSRLRVVVTLRADFYDRPLVHRDFAGLLRDGVETVLPFSPEELERAITGPARSVGVDLEEGLLASVVADVVDEPGALPLLQYALTELYERRDGTTLTREAYEAIGGISGALAGRAEALYEDAGASGREVVRQLFLQLVAVGESVDTRRRVPRAELDSLDVDLASLADAVDAFGAARLLSFDRDPRTGAPTVEVAHEALLAEWGRLEAWVASARESLRAHRRLAAAAGEWLEGGRDASMLLRGRQLERFETLAEESGLARTEVEREYLAAGVAAREAERHAEEARQARESALERRSLRRLRALVGVLAVAALAAAGLTVFAFQQSNQSSRQARIARTRQLAAASVANLDVDPELSILLALRAVETSGGGARALPEAVEALHRAVGASRLLRTIHTRASTASFSPDGSEIAAAGADGVATWDASTGRRVTTFAGPGSFRFVAFDPRGLRVAAATASGTVSVWSARSGRRLGDLAPPTLGSVATGLAFSSDGTRLAVDGFAGLVGEIWVWDLRSRSLSWKRESQSVEACGIAWSPDGTRLATGDCSTHFLPSRGRIWDLRTGRVVVQTAPQAGALPAVAFSRDGRYVVTTNRSGYAQAWDARTGRLVSTFTGHTGEVTAVASGPGTEMVTGGTDGTARVWDATTGKELIVLAGGGGPVQDVSFSRDGGRVVTTRDDGTVEIWDVGPGGSRDWMTLLAHAGAGVESVAYDPSGKRLLTSGLTDPKEKLWDARSGRLLATYDRPVDSGVEFIPGSGLAPQVSLESPDGRLGLDLHSSNEFAVLRDARDGRVLARWGRSPQSAAFDSTGARVALGNVDGSVEVWGLDSRPFRLLRVFDAGNGRIDAVAFSSDGRTLATGGEDTQVRLWDIPSGKEIVTLFGPRRSVSALTFSPDGTRVAAGSRDGTVRVYVIPVDELTTVARSRLTRGWKRAECAQYLPGGRCPSRP